MDDMRVCSECGIELPATVAEGLCTKCLLKAGLEKLAGDRHLHIRCPHCRNPIELIEDAPLRDITCPSCDSKFSLIGDATTTASHAATKHLGQFELIEQIGLGGFGAVWKARDTELDRIVAIKVPRRDQLDATNATQFMREARAAAQVKHSNIVSVHEVGRAEDIVYIVSDYVDGVTLADWLSAHDPTPREAAGLCAHLAEALQHAHMSGVIHRDLKPTNVMIDAQGEPHIMDFGLAKRDAGEITMTVDGRVLGTPAYMSPEQARGHGHHADARSDVYSLGVILFEMLTSEKPFRGTSRMLLHQVIYDDAPQPRKLNNLVPKDLETICLKCLEKDAHRRYQESVELATDLRSYLANEPIRARPISEVERSWRWCQRNPVVAGLTAVVATLLLAFAVAGPVVAWQRTVLSRRALAARQDALSAQQQAVNEADRARLAERETRRLLYASDLAVAQHAFGDNDIGRVDQLLHRHRSQLGEEDFRGFEWYYLWRQCHLDLASYRHEGMVWDVAFSPIDNLLATTSSDGRVRVWDQEDPDLLRRFDQPPRTVVRLDYSRDGSLLVGSGLGVTCVWKVETGDLWQVYDGGRRAAISPDNSALAIGMYSGGEIFLWDLKTHKHRLLGTILDSVDAISFSPDGKLLVASSMEREFYLTRTARTDAKVWSLDSNRILDIDEDFDLAGVQDVQFSPDGRLLAFLSHDEVLFWNVPDWSKAYAISSGGYNLSFAPDGKLIGIVGESLKLWNLEKREQQASFPIAAFNAAFSNDGRLIAATDRAVVRLWNVDADIGPLTVKLFEPTVPVDRLIVQDGRIYALGWQTNERGDDTYKLSVYDLANELVEPRLNAQERTIHQLITSPDHFLHVIGTEDEKLEMWELGSPNDIRVLGELTAPVLTTAVSKDGSTLALLNSHEIQIWNLRDRKLQTTIPADDDEVGLTLSHNGSCLAVIYYQLNAVAAFNTNGGDLRFRTVVERPFALQFSADSENLAVHELNQRVLMLNASTGELNWEVDSHYTVNAFAFSPDGKTMAWSGWDTTVRLFDAGTGEPRFSLTGANDHVHSLQFSSDGRTLVAGTVNGEVTVWNADVGDGTLSAAQNQVPPEDPTLDAAMRAIRAVNDTPPGEERDKMFQVAIELVSKAPSAQPRMAALFNSRAWDLAMGPDIDRRQPPEAVALAEQAVEIVPMGGFLLTLGAAYYRDGQWQASVEALLGAQQRLPAPSPTAAFLMAMNLRIGPVGSRRKILRRGH